MRRGICEVQMRPTRSKPDLNIRKTASREQLLADFICQSLFTKTSDVGVPGLTMGTVAASCGNCYYFQVSRNDLHLSDDGADIVGPCNRWGSHTSAHKHCPAHTEGGPDVR